MKEGDLAAFSASTSGTASPVEDGSADLGKSPCSLCFALAKSSAGEAYACSAHCQDRCWWCVCLPCSYTAS